MAEKLSGKTVASSSSSSEPTPLSEVKVGLHMRFSAAVCREILKLGHSKKEKALGKEYLRLLNMQELSSWVRSDSVRRISILCCRMFCLSEYYSLVCKYLVCIVCSSAHKIFEFVYHYSYYYHLSF